MEIEFDATKSERNAAERGLPFSRIADFDWQTATIEADLRFAYPEPRFVTAGRIGVRVHIVCFSRVAPNRIRVISFRKANRREVRRYEQKTQSAADR